MTQIVKALDKLETDLQRIDAQKRTDRTAQARREAYKNFSRIFRKSKKVVDKMFYKV